MATLKELADKMTGQVMEMMEEKEGNGAGTVEVKGAVASRLK
jgi:hypothetical protein